LVWGGLGGGVGGWGRRPTPTPPNPKSPIPNPQSPIKIYIFQIKNETNLKKIKFEKIIN